MFIAQAIIVILMDRKIMPMLPYFPALFSAAKRNLVTLADLPTSLALGIMGSILFFSLIVYMIICFLIIITVKNLNKKLRLKTDPTFITVPRRMVSIQS